MASLTRQAALLGTSLIKYERLTVKEELGKGSYGIVYRAHLAPSTTDRAVPPLGRDVAGDVSGETPQTSHTLHTLRTLYTLRALHAVTGDVALKKLKQMPATPRELQLFCREVQLLVQARVTAA